MTIDEVIDILENGKMMDFPVKRAIEALKNRQRFWLVVNSSGDKAVVRAPHVTSAIQASGLTYAAEAFELDADALTLPHPITGEPNMIMRNWHAD